jgi:hypothetical protein
MSWEQRLKEMLLAGGALAAAACSSGSSGSSFTGGDAASTDATVGGFDAAGGGGCCNAAPDPCCMYLYCEGGITPRCSQYMACEAEGGTWSYLGMGSCAGSQDAGDAGADGDVHD